MWLFYEVILLYEWWLVCDVDFKGLVVCLIGGL